MDISVYACVPCLVERCELTMFNQWANLVFTSKPSDLLVVVPLVIEQNIDTLGIALDQRRSDLAIVFSCRRHVSVEDRIHLRIDQQCHFELLNRKFSLFGVVF